MLLHSDLALTYCIRDKFKDPNAHRIHPYVHELGMYRRAVPWSSCLVYICTSMYLQEKNEMAVRYESVMMGRCVRSFEQSRTRISQRTEGW